MSQQPAMTGQQEDEKKDSVPLEEALNVTGVGWFTNYIMLVTGFVQFSAVSGTQAMSIIIPAAGCDLDLSGFDKGMLASASFTGMILSSFIFGSLADQFGRRTIMIYCGVMNAFLSIFASLAPTYLVILIIWFFNGFLLGGVYSAVFFYVSEFSPLHVRAKSMILPTCLGTLASIYLAGLAWLILPLDISIPIRGYIVISSWRIYLALLAVPTALSTFLLYKLPESPKYTLNKGNEEETLRTLKTMYSINQKKMKSEFPISSVCLDASDIIAFSKTAETKNVFLGVIRILKQQYVKLFTPPLLFYTSLSCSMLCGIIGMFNTLLLWLPEQMKMLMHHYSSEPNYRATLCQVLTMTNGTDTGGLGSQCSLNKDIFIISTITATLISSILVVISFLADKFGKKLFLVSFMGLSMSCCVALMFVNEFLISVIIYCLMSIVLASTFPVGLSIIVDFFPTSLRSSAVCMTLLFGRIATSVASQIFGALYRNHCEELYWGLFAILACTVILNLLAPSKRKR